MKKNKILKITVGNIICIGTIIFIFAIAMQLILTDKEKVKEGKNEEIVILSEEKVAENQNTRTNQNDKVTSRSSTTRNKNSEQPEEIKEEIEIKDEILETEPEVQYTKIEDVKISKDMNLTERTGLSKEDFKKLISRVKQDTTKFFYDNSDIIYDLCAEYQINEIFFCGLISAESGWNIASNHRRTYNYISLMSGGKLIKYSSLEEGLRVAAKTLHNNYLTEGGRFYYGKTLSAVKTKFCPSSNTWVNLVYGRMQQIIKSI